MDTLVISVDCSQVSVSICLAALPMHAIHMKCRWQPAIHSEALAAQLELQPYLCHLGQDYLQVINALLAGPAHAAVHSRGHQSVMWLRGSQRKLLQHDVSSWVFLM
jgi:hypothetical protein